MTAVSIDFETRSDIELKTLGMFRYFESRHARVLIGSYRIDGSTPRRWQYGEPCPDDLTDAIADGAMLSAHNAGFEICCFEWLHKNAGWPMPALAQFRCTAATASALALPRALDTKGAKTGLAEVLGLADRKDKEGERLIHKFSKPRRARDGEDPNGVYFNEPEDHPEDFEKFKAYCDQDVIVEDAADARMIPLSDYEQAVWQMTEAINRRGVRIDRRSARAAMRLAAKAGKTLDAEMALATGGYVTACSQVQKLTAWIETQGVAIGSLGKTEIADLLEAEDIPDNVRRALALRQEAGKTSTSKLKTMLARANADGRVRGGFIYHQAGTGRSQSVGVNWNNMPRPRKVFEDTHPQSALLFKALNSEDPALLAFLYPEMPNPPAPDMARFLLPNQDGALGRPLHLIADALRGFIWAAPGHDLVQADFSNIEGNVIAWTSGEEWKLQAIREINADPKNNPDMYRRTAAAILNSTTDIITKKHPMRQGCGKPAELGLSFGGGVMAFVKFARNGGVRLSALYEPVWGAATEERRAKATKAWESYSKRGLYGTAELTKEAWLACEIIKLGWREQNSAIYQSGKDLETAVREAVQDPGTVTRAAKVEYLVAHGFLFGRLPSGRCLAYAAPGLKAQVWAKVRLGPDEWSDAEVMDLDSARRGERLGDIKIEGPTSDKVTFLGVNDKKKWARSALYSGILAENNTQAIARDLLVNGMFKAEAAGYPIIATVYDEIISEVPRGYGSLKDFERMICELPDWASGLPLVASGWRGKRYRKD